jgi:ribosomal-protein-alanine N-acetyltransferase
MMGIITRLFAREVAVSQAGPADARDLAALHAASFHRGWSEDEFDRLLADRQGRGLARQLLDTNLRRLAALGARSVFLEAEEGNVPARRLYRRTGFREVGRREAYYAAGHGAAALVLRRDLP